MKFSFDEASAEMMHPAPQRAMARTDGATSSTCGEACIRPRAHSAGEEFDLELVTTEEDCVRPVLVRVYVVCVRLWVRVR